MRLIKTALLQVTRRGQHPYSPNPQSPKHKSPPKPSQLPRSPGMEVLERLLPSQLEGCQSNEVHPHESQITNRRGAIGELRASAGLGCVGFLFLCFVLRSFGLHQGLSLLCSWKNTSAIPAAQHLRPCACDIAQAWACAGRAYNILQRSEIQYSCPCLT